MKPFEFLNNKFTGLILLSLFASLNCSFNSFIVNQAAGLMESGKSAFETESDLEIAETALAANLKLLEALLQKDPENIKLRLFLAQGYSLYSLAFAEDHYEEYSNSDLKQSEYQKQRAVLFYTRAREYAAVKIFKKMGIASTDEITRESLENYLKNVAKADVGHLFWFGFSWGSAINLQRDDTLQLASLPFIEIIMRKVKALDENFYQGGVYLFEGMYYGDRPPMLGGNMEKSKAAFDKAMKISNNKLLLVPYFKAKTYCIQTQDYGCFKENIQAVLNAPEDLFPQNNLANALARKKALRLRERSNDFFIEEDH
jgi:tetratricopeptide (TPR) repeat protein